MCWWLCLGALALAADEVVEPQGLEGRVVTLVTSGGSGGFGAERYPALDASLVAGQVASWVRSVGAAPLAEPVALDAVLHRQGSWFVPKDGLPSTAAALVQAGDAVRCDGDEPVAAWATPFELVIGGDASWLVDAEQAVALSRGTCRAGDAEAWWFHPPGVGSGVGPGLDVDVRKGWSATSGGVPVWVLGLPRGEAARRVAALRTLRRELPEALYVEAGGFVDGASAVEAGGRSLHRENAWRVLRELAPDVVVPGPSELSLPREPSLPEEEGAWTGLPWVAANLARADLPPMPATRVVQARASDGSSIALGFVGMVDPDLVRGLGDGQGVLDEDPVAVVQAAVDALLDGGEPVDAVVLVALAGPELLADLRRHLRGVDVLLGDVSAATYRVQSVDTVVREVPRRAKAAPVTLPLAGAGVVRLVFGSERLQRVEVQTVPITTDAPVAEDVQRQVAAVRLQTYPTLEEIVLEAGEDGLVSDAVIEDAVCRAVLSSTGADIVLLGALPGHLQRPGDLAALDLSTHLALPDRVQRVEVDGDRLAAVLALARDVVPVQCGAQVGVRAPKVAGRDPDPDRTYLVATTDRTLATTALGGILASGTSGLVGHRPQVRPVLDAQGRPASLNGLARDTLADPVLRARLPDGDGSSKRPEWVFRARRISLRVESFGRPDRPPGYDQVPESLLNSPGSLTLGTEVDLAVERSGADVTWDLRARAAYTRLAVADAAPQETADDWRLSTSLDLPLASFPRRASVSLRPYAELLYDSEFTPVEPEDGSFVPRQADLSLTLGLGTNAWKSLRRLRLGMFVNQDMGRLQDRGALGRKTPEYGGRFEGETRVDLPPGGSLRWTTSWDVAVFGSTPQDDAADLRWRAWGETRVQVRVWRFLNLAVYANGLLAQGRVPETQQVAVAGTVGAALDVVGAFRLDRRARVRPAGASGKEEVATR